MDFSALDIVNTLKEVILVIKNSQIIYANKKAQKIFYGKSLSQKENSNINLNEVFGPVNVSAIQDLLKPEEKGTNYSNIEYIDQEYRKIYYRVRALYVSDKKYYILSFNDISDYRKEKLLKDCIFRISEASHYIDDLDELYKKIHNILSDVIYTKNFYIAIADWDNELIKFPYFVDEFDAVPSARNFENGLTEHVLNTGEPVLVDSKESEKLAKNKKIDLLGTESNHWLGIPLKIGQSNKKTFGLIAIQTYDENIRFSEDDKKILLFVSDQIAMAIKRKIDNISIKKKAYYDHLTGLTNKILFNDRLEQAIYDAQRNESKIGILFIDLDNFKFINDSMGHTAGDSLLKVVSKRLQACFRKTDTIARWGGDEFTVILPKVNDVKNVYLLCSRILSRELNNIVIDNQELRITASIGVSFYPQDGEDIETLIKNADTAMYKSKELGKNQFQLYKPEMNEKILERINYETNLFKAIENKEFILLYQPQMDLNTNKIIGFESLIRWVSPKLGTLTPYKFIPIAEETNLILPLGKWIIEQTCLQNKKWHDLGYEISSAVNISAKQFMDDNIIQIIKDALINSGLPPNYLDLELTETILMEDSKRSVDVLKELKSMGINISIDDFGTGYSSLSYLKMFPIDTLKIDQSFISSIDASKREDSTIANIVIDLGHRLGMNVIAEGVETQEQIDFLRKYTCDKIQGYVISEPVNEVEFSLLLDKK